MLERAGGAFIAFFVGLLLFADAVFGLWMALLVIAVALILGSSVARWREEVAQEQLLVSRGGPSRQRVTPPWLVAVAVVVAAAVAVPFLVASIVLVRWSESLTRVSQLLDQSDVGQAAVLAGEVQQLTLGLMLSLTATALLPLVAAGIVGSCSTAVVGACARRTRTPWRSGRTDARTNRHPSWQWSWRTPDWLASSGWLRA